MNGKLVELAERRAALVARAATQRLELSQSLALWRGPLTVADEGLSAVRFIRNHAELLFGVAALVTFIRPLRVARLVKQGWLFWHLATAAKRILRSL